jgi:hypothetical protein
MGFHNTAALTRELDEEWKALTTLGLTLDAAKKGATELMRRYPAAVIRGDRVSRRIVDSV